MIVRIALHCLTVLLFAIPAAAQVTPPAQFHAASIVHNDSYATVSANDPRPLLQAVTAVREEHGWIVDYEDPIYAGSDLVDWVPGHKRIAGGQFKSTYPNPAGPTGPSEAAIISKIVSDFDQSSNPGRFVVRDEGTGRYSVVGVSTRAAGASQATPILDTKISLPSQLRSVEDTVRAIMDQLTMQTGIRIVRAGIANNVLAQRVEVGGDMVAARTLLMRALLDIRPTQVWTLTFDPDSQSYALGITPALVVTYDVAGHRRVRPAQPAPRTRRSQAR